MAQHTRAMVISPHPDDSEFGIGGTVAKWARQGTEVIYVICSDGSKGSEDLEMTPRKLAAVRKKETLAAAKVLGVKEVVFLRHLDQTLEDTPEFRKELVRLIRMHRPDVVATSDPYRRYIWHRDHRVTGQVVLDAVYPFARNRPAYPDLIRAGLEPHTVREVFLWGSDDPNYCSDITSTFDLKVAALKCHQSQVAHIWPRIERMVRQRCEKAASGKGFVLGESLRRIEIPY
ncbi:MAG: PIG-L deacetylase family protein [Chloroflexota bacterium]